MSLLKSLIENKLEKFDQDILNNEENIWDFCQALNLSKRLNKKKSDKINKLFLKAIDGDYQSRIMLNLLLQRNRRHIYEKLAEFDEEIKENEIKTGNFWKKGRFAVASFEYR